LYLSQPFIQTSTYYLPSHFTAFYFQYDPKLRYTSTALREDKIYATLYVFWSKFILIEFIPYSTILVMNIFIIIKITKSIRFRRRFQRGQSNEVYIL
jgi:hypothetical protein